MRAVRRRLNERRAEGGPLVIAVAVRDWRTLLEECDALAVEATLIPPLAETRFRLTDVQEPRIFIEFVESSDSQPLQREQFETLAEPITDAGVTFELQRLPPDAEPYAAVLALHVPFRLWS